MIKAFTLSCPDTSPPALQGPSTAISFAAETCVYIFSGDGKATRVDGYKRLRSLTGLLREHWKAESAGTTGQGRGKYVGVGCTSRVDAVQHGSGPHEERNNVVTNRSAENRLLMIHDM